ncbi:MAG: outer membrane protein transport protein [Deltaproteobacteria bacterium]|nr:outer membrane protein transport protein [Deltaproteobacteria bacterium]
MRRAIAALLVCAGTVAQAGGLVVSGGSPRTIGRAGAGVIGDDGAGALVYNPAAMARRDGSRGQLGMTFIDDELSWDSDDVRAPTARSQSPSSVAPYGAAIASVDGWVIAAGAMTTSVSERAMRPPGELPPGKLDGKFDFRYAGIASAVRRDTVTIGVARRLGDQLAAGLAVGASRFTLGEVRRMWAGFDGRDRIGDDNFDLEMAMNGVDAFVPNVVGGILFAPEGSRLEIGASLAWSGRANIEADVEGVGTRPKGPSLILESPYATLEVRQPVTARLGVRYLGERLVVELDGEYSSVSPAAASATWRVHGARVRDPTSAQAELIAMPSRVSMRTHGAVRAGLDFELIPGFLWATAGYAYALGSVSGSRQSPTFADLGGHTFAVGLEGSAGGFTFTFGWARTWSSNHRDRSVLELDNPYAAGSAIVPTGTYDGSADQIGIMLDFELAAPK